MISLVCFLTTLCRWHAITKEKCNIWFLFFVVFITFSILFTGWLYVHRTLALSYRAWELACCHARTILIDSLGRASTPREGGGRSIEHPAQVLLWATLVYWTEIPLQWRSAQCCFVCGRWKSQWNQELLWLTHAENHVSLPFCVHKICHS